MGRMGAKKNLQKLKAFLKNKVISFYNNLIQYKCWQHK